jgi:hypothetical protein
MEQFYYLIITACQGKASLGSVLGTNDEAICAANSLWHYMECVMEEGGGKK